MSCPLHPQWIHGSEDCPYCDEPPADWQAGWNACIKAMEDTGIDATTIIADHTRKLMKEAFDKWKMK